VSFAAVSLCVAAQRVFVVVVVVVYFVIDSVGELLNIPSKHLQYKYMKPLFYLLFCMDVEI
jgi:hypothetical protein